MSEWKPCCNKCGKQMINAYDSKLKAISPYLWKTTCKHNEDMILVLG